MFGIKVPVIKNCPVTRGSEGIIEMAPDLISQIAGAVRDDIEWLVLLIGKRSEDGYKITVESFRFPEQRRTGVDANADGIDVPPNSDIVGVMHSHHTMGAFFSGTDTEGVNKKFPVSIVVATARNELGFEYEAVGKVKLPCTSMGRIPFFISVTGAEGLEFEPTYGEENPDDWGDCSRITESETADKLVEKTDCGYVIESPKPFRFGMNGDAFIAAVKAATVQYPTPQQWAKKNKKSAYRPYSPVQAGFGTGFSKLLSGFSRSAKSGERIFARRDGLAMKCDQCDSGPWKWLRKHPNGDYVCMSCYTLAVGDD